MKKWMCALLACLVLLGAATAGAAGSSALRPVLVTALDHIVEYVLQRHSDRQGAPGSGAYQPDSVAWRLWQYMPDDENFLYSPLSLELALAMAANGAEGETQQQLVSLLPLSSLEEYNAYAKRLMDTYSGGKEVTLELANSIWLNTSHPSGAVFQNGYRQVIADAFYGTAREFTPQTAVAETGRWVSEKTHGKIRGILTQDLVEQPDFLACLINALYLKGQWASQFAQPLTRDGTFTSRGGTADTVPFMEQTGQFGYYEDADAQMVRLPYRDGKTAMYVALPAGGGMLDWEAYIEKMQPERVHIRMPKFRIETSRSLKGPLADLGAARAFDEDTAQFDAMFVLPDGWNAYIMDVLQKTYIEVDETGTEAAAVTAVASGGGSAPVPAPEIKEFCADRPFVFFIRDDETGQLLFIGSYAYAQ